MNEPVDGLMVLLVLLNLWLLASSRLIACTRIVAMEGIALGLLPLLLSWDQGISGRLWFIAAASVIIRGVIFPQLLLKALRQANVQREVEPFVGYSLSIVIGVLTLAISFWLISRLPLPEMPHLALMLPAALSTILIGLFVIISRKIAINQVLGYLVMENGIYVLGLALVKEIPALVELGVLLDAFVAVFVMTIATYHISREFEHLDADQLDSLKG